MIKLGLILGWCIIFHAAYSMREYRKYNQDVLNNEEYSLPLDIMVEALLGFINVIAGSYLYSNFGPGIATNMS
jgi:hypothetical protein